MNKNIIEIKSFDFYKCNNSLSLSFDDEKIFQLNLLKFILFFFQIRSGPFA